MKENYKLRSKHPKSNSDLNHFTDSGSSMECSRGWDEKKYPECFLAISFHPTSSQPLCHISPTASNMDISILIFLVYSRTEVKLCGLEVFAKTYLREFDLGYMNSDTLQEPWFWRTLTMRVSSSGTSLILWIVETVQEKDLTMLS